VVASYFYSDLDSAQLFGVEHEFVECVNKTSCFTLDSQAMNGLVECIYILFGVILRPALLSLVSDLLASFELEAVVWLFHLFFLGKDWTEVVELEEHVLSEFVNLGSAFTGVMVVLRRGRCEDLGVVREDVIEVDF
jgi:hypothetical protein